MGRRLRQGDHMSLFRLLISTEVLTSLTCKTVDIGTFRGYKDNEEITFYILQYVDDIILLRDDIWENRWRIKIILRSFEMVSGFKVNFVKIKLYGCNADTYFMETTSNFVSCSIYNIPIRFLEILVGANPRKYSMRTLMIDNLSKILSRWNIRYLSIGGRMV
ncbi:uncharacterized protein [Cicer arietinum]|uniref:Uncharacterized protein LOC101493846 n=1 Tax=Cicer arietinum TaxID=3827 RepID=A0A1S2Y7A4_CICAR|nr:uncharacterized protein LOC101493846 [Cicer arietinum]